VQSFVHGVRRQVAKHNVRIGSLAPGMVLNELWGLTEPEEIERRIAADTVEKVLGLARLGLGHGLEVDVLFLLATLVGRWRRYAANIFGSMLIGLKRARRLRF
jgi:NAD(P)-dependent dehydrogenase (short-subunit alcohol dehydrogenase family)